MNIMDELIGDICNNIDKKYESSEALENIIKAFLRKNQIIIIKLYFIYHILPIRFGNQ